MYIYIYLFIIHIHTYTRIHAFTYTHIYVYIQQVCSGSTGHTEGIQLLYNPDECTYEQLCAKLLSTVDSTGTRACEKRTSYF